MAASCIIIHFTGFARRQPVQCELANCYFYTAKEVILYYFQHYIKVFTLDNHQLFPVSNKEETQDYAGE